ncbi:glucokinase [Candidatus Babeliales bacterium]|nr:glucokinase [Candidatus Babeliales bacterium]
MKAFSKQSPVSLSFKDISFKNLQLIIYKKNISPKKNYILAADIGGTKSNFGLIQIQKDKPTLVLIIKIASKKITDFSQTINQILKILNDKYKIKPTKASIAAAGKISPNKKYVNLTNLKIKIDSKDILKKTNLKKIVLLNDFEAIGHALPYINKKSLLQINKTKIIHKNNFNKVILGAGTGLGKTFLIWNEQMKKYNVMASEGGHGDFASQNQEELDLIEFIRKKSKPVEWEDLLSGTGIKNIYKFLKSTKKYKPTKYSKEIDKNDYSPLLISKYGTKTPLCKKTFELFAKFYARSAKNFALEILATGGVYLAGKIATENLEIFKQKLFIEEFANSYKSKKILTKIPVYIITDYNIGLLGAAVFAYSF